MDADKRKTFTVRDKLNFIDGFKRSSISGRKYAASIGVSKGTLRKWLKAEIKLRGIQVTLIRKIRNVPRKKIGIFPEIDQAVFSWVTERNSKGLRVKDKFLQMRARRVRDEIVEKLEEGEYKEKLKSFKASKIYVHRFKTRFSLRSRRHTTTHTLPDRFREQAVDFISSVHEVTTKYNITREHIVNFDQV